MRILIVRVGRVGDVVMITAALKSLLEQYPSASFTVLTSPEGKRVLTGYDVRIKDIVIYDRKALFPYFSRKQLAQRIAADNFDQIFCFETNPSFYTLFKGSKAKIYGQQDNAVGLSDNKIQKFAFKCLLLAQQQDDIVNKDYFVNLPVSEEGRKKSTVLLQQLGVSENTLLIGMHPSCSGMAKFRWRAKQSRKNKLWPSEYWGELAQMLHQHGLQQGLNILLIMDLLPEEQMLGESIAKYSKGTAIFQCPPPDFQRYKATLQRMDLLITPDTGPMHIAAAVGTKIVALFSGKDPDDCGPYVPAQQFQILQAEQTQQAALGIAAITPDMVFSASKNFLVS